MEWKQKQNENGITERRPDGLQQLLRVRDIFLRCVQYMDFMTLRECSTCTFYTSCIPRDPGSKRLIDVKKNTRRRKKKQNLRNNERKGWYHVTNRKKYMRLQKRNICIRANGKNENEYRPLRAPLLYIRRTAAHGIVNFLWLLNFSNLIWKKGRGGGR